MEETEITKLINEIETEKQELNDRIAKLSNLVLSDKANDFNDYHMSLLAIQLNIMNAYFKTLELRLDDLD